MGDKVDIRKMARLLPELPGVYKYLDKNGVIIYVGKAKNLRRRVSSYFNKNQTSLKTKLLVRNICDMEYTVVETENDALLLENNLIKQYRPKYNVLLKDDKTYPWICIKNERFPRVFYTRRRCNDGSTYFGPFPSVNMVKTLLNLIAKLYPIRTCNLQLSADKIEARRYKECLEYHIGNCMAPCVGNVDEATYADYIADVHKILRGNLGVIHKYLTDRMLRLSAEMKYEAAGLVKSKIELLEQYQSKSTVVNTTISEVEVYGFVKDLNSLYVNYLVVRHGAILTAHSVELRKRIDESDEDMLLFAVMQIRELMDSSIKTALLPLRLHYALDGVQFEYPQRGDKRKVLDLAQRNARFFMLERHKQVESKNPAKHVERKLRTLQSDLRLPQLPSHIECFDNSNLQGTNAVAACVVFRDSRPATAEYRHYNVKTVDGPDDFASMREIVYRRYRRLLDEDKPLPQLIVIDGGKGQLSAACDSLQQLNLSDKIAVIAIAERLEEIYFPNDPVPLFLDKNSESLKLIQHLRDEAHRFGITFHRNKRSRSFLKSELDDIKGIGDKSKEALLQHFKTLDAVKVASLADLAAVVGKAKAKILFDYFNLPLQGGV